MNKITVILILITGIFLYYYIFRPPMVRRDCSWIEVRVPAVPEQPAISKEEAQDSLDGYNKCLSESKRKDDPFSGLFCDDLLKKERVMVPARPAYTYLRKATVSEYNFCIHENGLVE